MMSVGDAHSTKKTAKLTHYRTLAGLDFSGDPQVR